MPFNHDDFIASQNYLDLDASLAWWLTEMRPRLRMLQELQEQRPAKFRQLYQSDSVMRKFRRIQRLIDPFTSQEGDER